MGFRPDASADLRGQGFQVEICQLAARLLKDLDDFEDALAFAREEERIRRPLGNHSGLVLNLGAIAFLLEKMGRLAEAIVTAQEARELSKEIPEAERTWINHALQDIRHIAP